MFKVDVKFDGFGEGDILKALEKKYRDKLRQNGLAHVSCKVVKSGAKHEIVLNCERDEDLQRAASVLGIK